MRIHGPSAPIAPSVIRNIHTLAASGLVVVAAILISYDFQSPSLAQSPQVRSHLEIEIGCTTLGTAEFFHLHDQQSGIYSVVRLPDFQSSLHLEGRDQVVKVHLSFRGKTRGDNLSAATTVMNNPVELPRISTQAQKVGH